MMILLCPGQISPLHIRAREVNCPKSNNMLLAKTLEHFISQSYDRAPSNDGNHSNDTPQIDNISLATHPLVKDYTSEKYDK